MARPVLAVDIADQLRRDILRGKLAPGAPIKEREVAAGIKVSRTPMREAVRILAKEGLVTLRPARSPVVANPSFEEVRSNIEVLTALETLSGELACRAASEREIDEIAALHEKVARLYDRTDDLERFEIDMDFHRAIARASHNQPLAETHAAFLARLWRARFLSPRNSGNRERVLRQHGLIVEALQRRDAAAVKAEISGHLEPFFENVRLLFKPDTASEHAREPQGTEHTPA